MHDDKGWSPPRASRENLPQSLDSWVPPHVVASEQRGVAAAEEVYTAPIRSGEWREYEQRRKEWMATVTASSSYSIHAPSPSSSASKMAEERPLHDVRSARASYEAHPLRGSASPPVLHNTGNVGHQTETSPRPRMQDRYDNNERDDARVAVEEDDEEIQRMAYQLRVMRARIAALKRDAGSMPRRPHDEFGNDDGNVEEETRRAHEALLQHQQALEFGERQRRERDDSVQRSLTKRNSPHQHSPAAAPAAVVVDRALRFDPPASPNRAEREQQMPGARGNDATTYASPSEWSLGSLVKPLGRVRIELPSLRAHHRASTGPSFSSPDASRFSFPLMLDVEHTEPHPSPERSGALVSSMSSEAEVVVLVAGASGSSVAEAWWCFVQGQVQQQCDCRFGPEDNNEDVGCGGDRGNLVTAPYSVWLTVELLDEPTSHSYQLTVYTAADVTWRSEPAEITSLPLSHARWLDVEVVAAGYRQWWHKVRTHNDAAVHNSPEAVPPMSRAEARRQRLTALLA